MGEAGWCLLPVGVILRILDWAAMRGSYGAASFSMAAWVAGAWGRGEDGWIDLGRLWRLRW